MQEILSGLQQPKDFSGVWSKSDLLRRANICMRKIIEQSECLKLIDTSNVSVSGTSKYPVPSGCSKVTRVAYGNIRIFGINEAELDMLASQNNQWQNSTGPVQKYIDFSKYTPSTLVLWPTPSDSGTIITIEYVAQPTELVNDTDIPFNGNANFYSFHDLIAKGVIYMCLLEQERPFYMEWKAQYEKGMQELKEFVRNMPDTMMSTLLISSSGQGKNISPLPGFRGY